MTFNMKLYSGVHRKYIWKFRGSQYRASYGQPIFYELSMSCQKHLAWQFIKLNHLQTQKTKIFQVTISTDINVTCKQLLVQYKFVCGA
jgi:hypothetical protein